MRNGRVLFRLRSVPELSRHAHAQVPFACPLSVPFSRRDLRFCDTNNVFVPAELVPGTHGGWLDGCGFCFPSREQVNGRFWGKGAASRRPFYFSPNACSFSWGRKPRLTISRGSSAWHATHGMITLPCRRHPFAALRQVSAHALRALNRED